MDKHTFSEPELERFMEQLATPAPVSVPGFDLLVARARATKRRGDLQRGFLRTAALLALVFLPAVWIPFVNAPVIEQDAVADIYFWDAPSDVWFTADAAENTASAEVALPTDQLLFDVTTNLDSL